MSSECEGLAELVRAVDAAVLQDRLADTVYSVRDALANTIRQDRLVLPQHVREVCNDHYARRELYGSRDKGYVIVVMTWAPGQGTPIHDHGGKWGVEGIWAGALQVTNYTHREVRDARCRFTHTEPRLFGRGAVGWVIPPEEHHTVANVSTTEPAVSVHIYGQRLNACNVYDVDPQNEGWYWQRTVRLALDLEPAVV